MKQAGVAFALILASGGIEIAAIDVPQNRREFVAAATSGKGATVEKVVADKGFEKIYSLLREKISGCLDVTVNRRANVGYVEVSSSDYNPTLRRVGGNRAEFALQVVHRPRGVGHTPPPGGLYIMAADLRSLGANRAEVTVYRPNIGFKKIARALMQWAAGEDADCPKMP
jgi:hypothetical protein